MLSQASHMQEEVQRKLEVTVVEGSERRRGGHGNPERQEAAVKIKIDPSAVAGLIGQQQPDVEMLEDLIVAAVNEAGRKAEEAIQTSVQGMLGGLKMPGLG